MKKPVIPHPAKDRTLYEGSASPGRGISSKEMKRQNNSPSATNDSAFEFYMFYSLNPNDMLPHVPK